jgi:hypothetical protein
MNAKLGTNIVLGTVFRHRSDGTFRNAEVVTVNSGHIKAIHAAPLRYDKAFHAAANGNYPTPKDVGLSVHLVDGRTIGISGKDSSITLQALADKIGESEGISRLTEIPVHLKKHVGSQLHLNSFLTPKGVA